MGVIRSIIIALRFLTILPLPDKEEIRKEELGNSMAYFPLIGIFIGLLLVFAYTVLMKFFSPLLTAVLVTGLWAGFTGFLHLEGFVDAADGFSASREKEKILAIMKDHHCGAKGVIALAFLILLKTVLVNDIPDRLLVASLLLTPAIGRWVMVYAASTCPYARKGEGFGKAFVENVKLKELLIASGILVTAGIGLLQVKFIVVMIPVLVLAFSSCFYVKRKIGGVTGDILGAMNELAEAVSLGTFLLLR